MNPAIGTAIVLYLGSCVIAGIASNIEGRQPETRDIFTGPAKLISFGLDVIREQARQGIDPAYEYYYWDEDHWERDPHGDGRPRQPAAEYRDSQRRDVNHRLALTSLRASPPQKWRRWDQ